MKPFIKFVAACWTCFIMPPLRRIMRPIIWLGKPVLYYIVSTL